MTIDGDQFRQYHPNFQQLQKLVGADIAFVTGPFYGKWFVIFWQRLLKINTT